MLVFATIGDMESAKYRNHWLYYYLLIQGMGGVVWWAILLQLPESRAWFLSKQLPEPVLMSFWLPDLLIFIAGSFIVAYGYRKQRSWFFPALFFLTGGISYVSLYCLALSFSTKGGWLGTLIMFCSMLIMLVACYVIYCQKIRVEESGHSQ